MIKIGFQHSYLKGTVAPDFLGAIKRIGRHHTAVFLCSHQPAELKKAMFIPSTTSPTEPVLDKGRLSYEALKIAGKTAENGCKVAYTRARLCFKRGV